MFGLIIGKVCLSPCLFFEGVAGAICFSGIFEVWNKFAPESSNKSRNSDQGCCREAKIGPRAQKRTILRERVKHMAPKWEPTFDYMVYFRLFLMCCSIIFGSILAYVL